MKDLTILFFGKTGVGKSSTLNKLFGLNWAVDDSVACTKEPQFCYLDQLHWDNLNLPYKQVQVVDMPGIGESISDDENYMTFYEEWMPKTHSLVWVTQADTRAYKRDEIFLLKLSSLFSHSLFLTVALNKIDYLGVDDGEEGFNAETGRPSEDQLRRVNDKIDDIYEIFKGAIGEKLVFEKNQIVPYTSIYGWGMQDLKDKILLRG
jgi:predicted GTPase